MSILVVGLYEIDIFYHKQHLNCVINHGLLERNFCNILDELILVIY